MKITKQNYSKIWWSVFSENTLLLRKYNIINPVFGMNDTKIIKGMEAVIRELTPLERAILGVDHIEV